MDGRGVDIGRRIVVPDTTVPRRKVRAERATPAHCHKRDLCFRKLCLDCGTPGRHLGSIRATVRIGSQHISSRVVVLLVAHFHVRDRSPCGSQCPQAIERSIEGIRELVQAHDSVPRPRSRTYTTPSPRPVTSKRVGSSLSLHARTSLARLCVAICGLCANSGRETP